jgi:hydrogenase/urease accessory protein HupE
VDRKVPWSLVVGLALGLGLLHGLRNGTAMEQGTFPKALMYAPGTPPYRSAW